MSIHPVGAIVCLGIDAVQMAHAGGKVSFRGFDEEVVVVAHEAVGVAEPVEALDGLAEDGKEGLAVVVIGEDVRPGVAAGGDVIDGAGEFYA